MTASQLAEKILETKTHTAAKKLAEDFLKKSNDIDSMTGFVVVGHTPGARVIDAIKDLRNSTGLSLLDAKTVINDAKPCAYDVIGDKIACANYIASLREQGFAVKMVTEPITNGVKL